MASPPEMTPESLTARIIAELQEYPEARALLLRALLTDEFLAMPARLMRVEEDVAVLVEDVSVLKEDVAVLKTDVAVLKTDVAVLKTDVGELKGFMLEVRAVQQIQSIVTQRLGLRRPATVHSVISPMSGENLEVLQDAEEIGKIRAHGDTEVLQSDLLVRAQRRSDRQPVWVAVEVSYTIDQHDITRAQERSEMLRDVYSEASYGVVAGKAIRPEERDKADSKGVLVVML